ncbi:MAG: hypothetical protein JXR70_16050 [Spirochaetales bacterium]|nr:hypothetical protein [Spirochaetales bacterium]
MGNLKKILIALIIFISLSGFSQENKNEAQKTLNSEMEIPAVAVMDVYSEGYDAGKTRVLTDFLRTELFKTQIFKILERGEIEKILAEHKLNVSGLVKDIDLLKIGEFLSVKKLLITTLGKFSDTTAINIRIIDVKTSLIDFTDNGFIQDENQIFDSIKDMVKKIELFYSVKGDINPQNTTASLYKKWGLLGASEEQARYLMETNMEPESFLEIRQYDISFKIDDFITVIKSGWKVEDIRQFLQYGISYPQIQKALSYGIADLSNFRNSFAPKGLSFDDYLDAYANHIVSASEYIEFKEGYRKDRLVVGGGGVADMLPLANANLMFLTGHAAWEHYWTKYQRDWFKMSTEAGAEIMFSLNPLGIIPIPFAQMNFYFGNYPFYGKLGIGGHAEVVYGGHFAMMMRLGIEILEQYEFSIVLLPIGTQPLITYSPGGAKQGEEGYDPINYPYFAAEFVYKL